MQALVHVSIQIAKKMLWKSARSLLALLYRQASCTDLSPLNDLPSPWDLTKVAAQFPGFWSNDGVNIYPIWLTSIPLSLQKILKDMPGDALVKKSK